MQAPFNQAANSPLRTGVIQRDLPASWLWPLKAAASPWLGSTGSRPQLSCQTPSLGALLGSRPSFIFYFLWSMHM